MPAVRGGACGTKSSAPAQARACDLVEDPVASRSELANVRGRSRSRRFDRDFRYHLAREIAIELMTSRVGERPRGSTAHDTLETAYQWDRERMTITCEIFNAMA